MRVADSHGGPAGHLCGTRFVRPVTREIAHPQFQARKIALRPAPLCMPVHRLVLARVCEGTPA